MLRYIDFQPLRFSLRCDRGGFFALYGIAPRASAVYGRSLGGVFCVIWLQPARRLEMRKSSHSVAFSIRPCGPPSLYCTMSGGHLIMLVKRIICDLMISNASTHWPSFIVHTLSGACLASTSRRLQKEAPNSGYRVTESDERAHSVTERRQYHRVVPGRPHNAQTSTHWPSYSSCRSSGAWSRFNVQTAPEGGSEQRISRHGVG